MTIFYDPQAKQILTPLCRQCPDEQFAPADDTRPHVGCCSYSPTFTLLEIYKMIKAGQLDFFIQRIYHHPNRSLKEFEITIHAHVAPSFFKLDLAELSKEEYEEKKLGYSICQFFNPGKGCTLPPAFKTSTCRAFICLAVEKRLDKSRQQHLADWSREIQQEARHFNSTHKLVLKERGWNLREHLFQIIDYLEKLN